MNKLKLLIFALLLTFLVSCGQQKRYITYKVKEGETMQDIAKRLDIETKTLFRLNPDVSKNPIENTTIIIPEPGRTSPFKEITVITPSKKEVTTTVVVPTDGSQDSTKLKKVTTVDYEEHTVAKGETIYSLTRKYGISKEELVALNPTSEKLKNDIVSLGQVLIVRKTIIETHTYSEENLKGYVTHTVQPKETVYQITRLYDVSKEDLVLLNENLPKLKDDILKIGEIIKIKPISEDLTTNTAQVYTDNIQVGTTIDLSILLPFKAKKYNALEADNIFSDDKKRSKLAHIVTDLYMGAEIAIDSIRKQGINVNVHLFDTGDRGKNVSDILSQKKLDSTDVIIGPLYSDKATLVAKAVNVPVIYPHYSKKQTEFSSKRLVKTAPDYEKYASVLTSYLNKEYTNETIFVVGDGKELSNKLVEKVVSDLKNNEKITEVVVLKPVKNYIKKQRFTEKMKPKTHCWIIMTGNNNATLADALNSMVTLPKDVTARVFAVDKNNAYNKINNNDLARMNFTFVSNEFINEKDPLTSNFEKKYISKNHVSPSKDAIRGFDVTYDVLIRMASGDKLRNTFKQGTSLRIANKFEYHNSFFGATSNYGLFLVKYNSDLSLSKLK